MIKFMLLWSLLSFFQPVKQELRIYIVKENDEELLLKEDEIEAYLWNEHEIVIKEAFLDSFINKKIKGENFAIKINNKLLYEGLFENSVKSNIGLKKPAILISPLDNLVLKEKNLKIWYKEKGVDRRNNKKLHKYLDSKGLLR